MLDLLLSVDVCLYVMSLVLLVLLVLFVLFVIFVLLVSLIDERVPEWVELGDVFPSVNENIEE